MDIKDIINDFLDYGNNIKGYSQHTLVNYRIDLKMFYDFCQTVNITDFTKVKRKDVENFIIHLKKEKQLKASTRNRRLSAVKKLFSYAEQQDIIDRAPNLEDLSSKVESRLPIYLNVDEAKALLRAPQGRFEARDRAIIATLLFAGLRISELINLKTNDIDLVHRKMKIRGKGDKEREIPIQYDLLILLEKYVYYHRIETYHDYVFTTRSGYQMSARTVNRMIKKYTKVANIDKEISAHKLRHTFATMLYEDNDLLELKDLMGHANIATTQIYAHINSEAREQVINNSPLSSRKENGLSNL